MKPINIQEILEIVAYDPETEGFYYKKTGKVLTVDEYGCCTIYNPNTKERRKVKADKLSWMLYNQRELPEDYKIFHRNLISSNYSPDNLWAIQKDAFKKVTECLDNLDRYLKIQLHERDMHKWVVHYRKDSIDRRETFEDVDKARERFYEIRFELIKEINKFCITL